MDKINSESMNLNELNINKIKEIFPSVVVDGKINFEKLKLLLGEEIESSNEGYDFTWNGKKETIKFSKSPTRGTLLPDVKSSVNWENTNNLYIEGDNVEVLKLLQKTYYGKIKMIYIDPPYNTGSDFVYKDNYRDNIKNYIEITKQKNRANPETSGRFHTDWLNMMYSRLYLARNLLKRDGLIFISIDDNEITNLRMICNEIFGEGNFVATLKWKKKKQPSFLSNVASIMEYVVVYAKNYDEIEKLCLEKLSDSDKPIINASNKETERVFPANIRVKAETNFIAKGVYQNKSMSVEFLDDINIKDGRTTNSFRALARFRNDQELITKYCNDDLIFITKNLGFRRDLNQEEKDSGKTITDLLLDWGQNQDGSNELKSLFEIKDSDGVFDNPKPTLLIKNLITTVCKKDDIVLDFFSGSATTAHAVFEYNLENEDSMVKFILVQLPQLCDENTVAYKLGYKNICEIGKERIRKAAYKIHDIKLDKDKNENSLDLGFKVFKLDSSNIKEWDENLVLDEVSILEYNDTIKENRSNLDVAYEIMLKQGMFDKTLKEIIINNKVMYSVNEKEMLICLDNNITMDDVSEIAKISPSFVVFKEIGFENDNVKINALHTLKRLKIEEIKCI